MQTMGLDLHILDDALGTLGGPFAVAASFSFISRIPVGCQRGLPSLIDGVAGAPGSVKDALLDLDLSLQIMLVWL